MFEILDLITFAYSIPKSLVEDWQIYYVQNASNTFIHKIRLEDMKKSLLKLRNGHENYKGTQSFWIIHNKKHFIPKGVDLLIRVQNIIKIVESKKYYDIEFKNSRRSLKLSKDIIGNDIEKFNSIFPYNFIKVQDENNQRYYLSKKINQQEFNEITSMDLTNVSFDEFEIIRNKNRFLYQCNY